jgi:hypothetical protein
MRSFLRATVPVLLLSLGTAGPARAEARELRFSVTPLVVPLDSGFEVVVACNAAATSGTVTEVAAATVVRCSVDGRSAARGMPGGESYVTVDKTVAGSSYTVCVSGQAAFVDPVTDQLELVSAGPYCEFRST